MINELFERGLQNTSINDVSLADYIRENYVSRSVLEQIRAELNKYDDTDLIKAKYVRQIIDKYKAESEEQMGESNGGEKWK